MRRPLRWLLPAVAVLLAAAHFFVTAMGLRSQGPLLVLDHIFELAVAAALFALSIGIGRSALRSARVEPDRLLETVCFSAAVGIALLGTAVLALGAVGVLDPIVLAILLVLLAVAGAGDAGELGRLIRRHVGALREDWSGWAWPAVAVVGLVAIFLVASALQPPAAWDTLMYHLEVPQEFLQAGRIHVPVDNLHVAFTGVINMVYAVFLAFDALSSPLILSALLGLLLGGAVFALLDRRGERRAAWFALVILWATPSILMVARTARVDVTLALFLFLAHYALVIAYRDDDRHWWYLSAALLGLSVGIKYHALAYGAALGPFVVWTAVRGSPSWTTAARRVSGFAVVALLAAAPWLIKNWVLLDGPLYPVFAERLLPPWLADVWGSRTHPSSVSTAIYGALGQAREPFNLWDAFFHPRDVSIEGESVFYNLNPLFLVLPPLALACWKDDELQWMWIPAAAYVALITVPFGTTNLRYLLPAVPMLTVAVASTAVRFVDRFLHRRVRTAVLAGLALAALVQPARAMYETLEREDYLWGHLAGRTSAWEVLVDRRNPALVTYAALTDFGRREIPDDARVLMLFEARGFYFDQLGIRKLQDNVLVNWPLLAPKAIEGGECLPETRITHVYLASGLLGYYLSRGLDPETVGIPGLRTFVDRCLQRTGEGSPVYRVRERALPENGGRVGTRSTTSFRMRE